MTIRDWATHNNRGPYYPPRYVLEKSNLTIIFDWYGGPPSYTTIASRKKSGGGFVRSA